MKKWIIVKTQFIGLHRWPAAPDEVRFLRDRHRHVFKIRLWLKVVSSDRELEFFIVQTELDRFIKSVNKFGGNASCEWIAEAILNHFVAVYKRDCKVEVSEDGENAALVESK